MLGSDELQAIRDRAELPLYGSDDRRALLTHIDTLTAEMRAAIVASWDKAGDPGHDGWMTDPDTFADAVLAILEGEHR